MIIKVSKTERNAIEKGCVLADLKVLFYSNETADGLLTAEVTDLYGGEPSNVMSFYLARQIESRIQLDEFINRK